jgi:hypothetical protein
MKINQLFKTPIKHDLLVKILICFGFNSTDDEHSFSKIDLEKLHTIDKLNDLKDEISNHYLPCKAKIYIDILDINKCITILRQIIRLQGQMLISKQKYIRQKKTTIYYIKKINDDDKNNNNNIKIDNSESKIINFI